MTITYKEIRERYVQLEKAQEEKRHRVVTEALKLVNAYKESLALENPTWTDIEGKEQSYVMVGYTDDCDFIKKPITSIEPDRLYNLSFDIATVINDSPRGGEIKLVSVSVSIRKGIVGVDMGNKYISIIADDWTEVCNLIKDQVFMSIRDSGLEDVTYF